MSIFVFGINHKLCPIDIREKLHLDSAQQRTIYASLKNFPEIQELVILSTCNRVEFYGCCTSLAEGEKAIHRMMVARKHLAKEKYEPYLYRYEAKDAMRHLFRVASGLDSLVVGENEILGQLRDAFRTANEEKSVHSILYRLMEKALKVGKQVREQTKINQGAVSIPSVAVELAEKIFGDLSGEKVMVLGTGEMSALALDNLRSAGAQIMYVASRQEDRGRQVASQFEAEWIPFGDWEKNLVSVDILLAATSAERPVVQLHQVRQAMEKRRHRPLFLIDIGVPRNIESEINQMDDVYLYNIDDLKSVSAANLKLRSRETAAAESMVDKAVLDYQSWLEQLKARPTLEKFESFLDEILERELSKNLRDLDLSDVRKKEIRDSIRAKVLSPTYEKIKESSQNGGVNRYLEALHSLFNLDKKDKP